MSHDREAAAKHLRRQRSPEQAPLEERLQDVLASVREDARTTPEEYARDTEVPAGGE